MNQIMGQTEEINEIKEKTNNVKKNNNLNNEKKDSHKKKREVF